MTARFLLFGLFVATTACGSNRNRCGQPDWTIAVIDDPAPLTSAYGEPVGTLEVRATDRCQRSLALDEFYVLFFTPPFDDLKATDAMFPDNLLLMELVDENDDERLGAREALLLREGPFGVVPPGIEWDIVLVLVDEDGEHGIARTDAVLIE